MREPARPTAIVSVDGFNLYRRCLEQHPCAKWLDLPALMDRGEADLYCLLTNDSDQVTTIRTLQEEVGVSVGWISPMPTLRHSKAVKQTRPALIACVTLDPVMASQLPEEVRSGRQTLRRPERWRPKTESPARAGLSNR